MLSQVLIYSIQADFGTFRILVRHNFEKLVENCQIIQFLFSPTSVASNWAHSWRAQKIHIEFELIQKFNEKWIVTV